MSKPKPTNRQEYVALQHQHDAITVTTSQAIFKTIRNAHVTRVSYISYTGVVADAVNYVVIEAKNGATVMGTWSTQTGQQGTIAANTSVDLVLPGTSDETLGADDTLSLSVTVFAAGSLPAGRINSEGYYF